MAILFSILIHTTTLACLLYALFKASSLKYVAISMCLIFPAILFTLTFLAKQMLPQSEFLLFAKQYLFLIVDVIFAAFLKVAKDGTKINKGKSTPIADSK